MFRYRSTTLLAILAALAAGCSATGTRAESAATAGTPAAERSSASATGVPPRRELTAPQAVGGARQHTREGLAQRMGVQLASLFADRSPTAVAAGFDINAPFYFAGINSPEPYPQDLAGQADLALRAAPTANSGTGSLTLVPAQDYASHDSTTALHCTVATLRGSTASTDIPVCAWADGWTIGLVMDFSRKVETGQGEADLQGAADLTLATRTAAARPAP
ncbi:hypothetical protein [Kitasatospora sp. NPDC057223]|uniref:hypothetical protein n=1 Tax=Kitasatospora sp. NPDC057223 TaxID=3346055 RepID=UPI0036349131